MAALVLAGAALLEAGGPLMSTRSEPALTLESVRRTLADLAAGYETVDLRKTGKALVGAEQAMATVFADRAHRGMRDAKAVYAQVLTTSASVAADVGDYHEAVRTGDLAASLAMEAGDAQTAGHAWSVVAGALLNGGSPRAAVSVAQRAHAHAGATPAGVKALVEEATAAATMGNVHGVIEIIAAAEEKHARLPPEGWGVPGFSLETFHLADLKAFAGWALNRVGLYAEASPRLAEAAELLAGTSADGLRSFVWLAQASAAFGAGDADGACFLVERAVAQAETRPAAWLAGSVMSMNNRSGGALAQLVERTAMWGF
jgi:hypothetical protein